MRALVTGATGFVGQWLCRELLRGGWVVSGTVFGTVVPTGTLTLDERRQVRWLPGDLRRQDDAATAVAESRPDAIFHLAGVSHVLTAQADPGEALEANVIGCARLLSEVRRRRRGGEIDPLVLVVGSGEQYGRHEAAEMPLAETAAQRPLTSYASSKAAQEIVALEAFRSEGVRVVGTRSFNHSGPGQDERFLIPALVRRALAARDAWQRELPVGNVDAVRDLLHVADVVRAYVLLAASGVSGEVYNVASGVGRSVRSLAEAVLAAVGVDAKLHVDPALVRPVDVPVLIGDATKLRESTGWTPSHSLDSIIGDLIRATA